MDKIDHTTIGRVVSAIALFLILVSGSAQTEPTVFWIQFTDKDATPYSITQPEVFLSARAIQRRVNQGVVITEQDQPVDPVYIATVLAQGDIELLNRSKWFNAITIRTTDQNALNAVLALPFVQAYEATKALIGSPVDDKFRVPTTVLSIERGGDQADYGPSWTQISMMNGQALHLIEAKGQGMLIGVLDSGFDQADSLPAFQDLFARNGVIMTRDMVDHDGDVYNDHWHGRSVLSCMVGHLPEQLKGTAPEADYVLIRTEDVDSEARVEEDNWIAGVELADSMGCDVINTSLGYTTFDDSLTNHTYAELDGMTIRISIAAGIASQLGMIPVQSAGNSGQSDWYYISAPADAIDILTVGAVGDVGNSAPFSSRGPSADGRVKPDVCAMGWGAIGLRYEGDSIAPINGTSFSSPILAGLVACLWQLHPERTGHDIMDAVRRSASLFMDPNDSLGYGIPNFGSAHDHLSMTTQIIENGSSSFGAFPMPFNDRLTIQLTDAPQGPVQVHLFDATGRMAWSAIVPFAGGKALLNFGGTTSLGEGAYVLRIISNDQVVSRVVVVAR
ncbi:MAG: S8 family peptidase [Flavobacteriales bacterium]|nr:S8 family peptidase [Flavobacteriales bacterium]